MLLPTTTTIDIKKPKHAATVKTFRHIGTYSKDAFCNAVLSYASEINKIYLTNDIDTQVDILPTVITRSLDECAPVVTTKINKPFAPWINTEIRSAMTARNALQERFKQNRTSTELQEQYRRERNRVKSLIHNSERGYYRSEFENCKNNICATWRLIRNIMTSKKVINNTYGHGNVLEKAEELNDLFVNVGERTYERTQSQKNHVNSE